MKKYEHAFGKNDIRGIYGDDITEELFYHTGRAFVKWLEKQSGKCAQEMKLTVTIDARTHSPSLRDALNEGITSTGASVINLGLAPTPIGYYSEVTMDEVISAVIITASHNPSEYNGMKMTYGKTTLNEAQIVEVKELTFADFEQENVVVAHGAITEYDILPVYLKQMKETFGEIGKGIKVVVDSANATGGVIGPQVYEALGCEVVELFSEPDGTFPNHHPNPSEESTLDTIKKTVKSEKADIGIAFDGDSDRIGAIDSRGKYIPGDMLLLIYALNILETEKSQSPANIVAEVKCSQAVFDTIDKEGGCAVMAKTGHGYIKAKMKETKAVFGGEMSGHTFFKDRYYGFDDAIYAGCRLIEIIAKNKSKNPNFKIEDILAPFEGKSFSSEERYHCPNEHKKSTLEKIAATIKEQPEIFGKPIKEINTLDGMRIGFPGGFALIRQSNTEPVFTLRFEAQTEADCKCFHETMVQLIKDSMPN